MKLWRSRRTGTLALGGASRRSRSKRRGVALVLVLSAITVLTVMLGEFQDQTSAELGSALSERDALRAEYAATSAVNLTRLLIAAEPTIRKSLSIFGMLFGGKLPQVGVWEYANELLGAFNDPEGEEAFGQLAGVDLSAGLHLGLDGARFEVDVVDEDSKINLNLAARGSAIFSKRLADLLIALMIPPQYDPLFDQRGSDGNFNDRATICSALIDWVDPDQEIFPCGTDVETAQQMAAEDSYYQLLDPPYQRKNAAFDSLEELHMVRGIGEDFWTTFFEPEFDDPHKRMVTVWGQEAVNLNSAPPQTLLALVCSNYGQPTHPLCTDPIKQETLLQILFMVKSFVRGVPIFPNPEDFVKFVEGGGMFGGLLQGAGVPPMQLNARSDILKMLTNESKIFSIYATGIVKNGQRETRVPIHAVVDFRSAPPPGKDSRLEALNQALGGAQGSAASTSSGQPDLSGLPEGATEDAVAKVLRPNPAGSIVYYRLN
jgi:general secretion pathway protein K